ncbi:WD40/YVTN/BNR-like repeat-containing protein, partial [candidate division KSB1 bacterium]
MKLLKYCISVLFILLLYNGLHAQNHYPAFYPQLTRGISVGETLTFILTASDPDEDILTWSASNLPPDASFNTSTQEFVWTPSDTGSYVVSFSVDDGQGHVVSKDITIKVVNKGDWYIVRKADFETSAGTVFFINDSVGWVVSWSGAILHTTNGGANWSAQTSGTYAPFYGVHFTDSNTGWAVGGNGTILHTTDGGTNWSTQTSGTSEYLFDVHFADANTGWVVGHRGTILHTTDGGINWSTQTSGASSYLRGVYFTDSNTGWVVGISGKILHTTDGGTNWSAQTSGTS